MERETLVVVGAGCAGVETAFSARRLGWAGPIVLLGDEAGLPYNRPPLSKTYLAGQQAAANIVLKPEDAFRKAGIDYRPGCRAVSANAADHRLMLSSGDSLSYDRLVIATGGAPRRLPVMAGTEARPAVNLFYLRNLADADSIRPHFGAGKKLTLIGGGFVGLEIAAIARKAALDVTLIETAPRLLTRVCGPEIAEFLATVHSAAGVKILLGHTVTKFEMKPGCDVIEHVVCSSGVRIETDLVIAGIGLEPSIDLALSAGVDVGNGIVVDDLLRTSVADIFAVGDCTRFHSQHYQRAVRLESVPNALDQARRLAAAMCGKPIPAVAIPWFWSDQYDIQLKTVGLSQGFDRTILRGAPADGAFSVIYTRDDRLLAIDTVNRPTDFMQFKALAGQRLMGNAERVRDASVDLQSCF